MDAHRIDDTPAESTPLFQRVLGDAAFAALPVPVRALHAGADRQRWRGQGQVARGRHPLALLMAWATRLPPTGTVPVEVRFDRQKGREHWRRRFGRHLMASTLWQQGDLLCERLGLVTFRFALDQQEAVLDWKVVQLRALGLRLPARWFVGVHARESADGERYTFSVDVVLPVIGLLVRYDGWLSPVIGDD